MKLTINNLESVAEKYFQNELTAAERIAVEQTLQSDAGLKQEWDMTLSILEGLSHAADTAHIKTVLAALDTPKSTSTKVLKFVKRNWKTSAIAASLLLASISTIQFLNKSNEIGKNQNQFTQLNREIQHIKNSQNNIINTINGSNLTPKTEPVYNLGGTGFALSNDGYIATNYHIISDNKSISIVTSNNVAYNAIVVGYDAAADIAILKITDPDFNFGKQNIPFNLKHNTKKVLGLKIFSVGYPQDNLVYNEGYISCENGYENDSLSYQLEIISNPGQSGSPVLDEQGNIIGLITGKNSNTSGTTYAVQADVLLKLINSLPDHIKINPPKNNGIARLGRTDQVDKIKQYIVTVKTAK